MVFYGKKQSIITIILAVLLVIAIVYIGYSFYNKSKEQRQLTFLQQGAQIGYQQAVVQIYSEAIKCNQVPVTVQNQTVNMIAVECLQALARQQQG